MKRLFILILVLLAFAIGCGNTDPNGGDDDNIIDDNTPIPDPSKPEDHVSIAGLSGDALIKANDALNEGVGRLGNLDGYAQYYYEKDTTLGGSEKANQVVKVYVKGNNVKSSEIYIEPATGTLKVQSTTAYSLETEITGFTLGYQLNVSHGTITPALPSDYTDYKMYDAKITSVEEKNVGDDWSTALTPLTTPLLIKIEPNKLLYTTRSSLRKIQDKEYTLDVSSDPPDFSKEVIVAGKF